MTESKYNSCNGIKEPADNDVVFGRGGFANRFPGNQRYQSIVLERAWEYAQCSKRAEKIAIGNQVIDQLRQEGTRFLRKDCSTRLWVLASISETRRKVSQRLRERAKELTSGTISDIVHQNHVPPPPAPLRRQSSRITVFTWDEDLVEELKRQTSLFPSSVCKQVGEEMDPEIPLQIPTTLPLKENVSEISVISCDVGIGEDLTRRPSSMSFPQTEFQWNQSGLTFEGMIEDLDVASLITEDEDVGPLVPIVIANALEWVEDEQ